MDDIQKLDRAAVLASQELVRQITPDQLGRPTPCAEWDLAALLAHLTVQHVGFARAVAGQRTEPADWLPTPVAEDFVAAYDLAVDQVLASFARPAESAYLPEIRGGITVPSAVAMRFHFVDYVVHSWDVAATLGLSVRFDDAVLTAALAVARQVPADDASRGPGTAFGPALGEPGDAATLDRVLAVLGRSPNWPR